MTVDTKIKDVDTFINTYRSIITAIENFDYIKPLPEKLKVDIATQISTLCKGVEELSHWSEIPTFKYYEQNILETRVIKAASKPIYLISLIWLIFEFGDLGLIDINDDTPQLTLWGIGLTGLTEPKLTQFFKIVAILYSARLLLLHLRRHLLCKGSSYEGNYDSLRVMIVWTFISFRKFQIALQASDNNQSSKTDLLKNERFIWLIKMFLFPKASDYKQLLSTLNEDTAKQLISNLQTAKGIYWRHALVNIPQSIISFTVPAALAAYILGLYAAYPVFRFLF